MPQTDTKIIAVLAPAKINLYLHVTGRRADGYHTLDSLVVFADMGDRIRLKPAKELSFSIDGPYARAFPASGKDSSPNSANLVVRAAHRLADAIQRDLALDIRLTKNLPPASGIGGGSTDAAATIWALLEWWGIPPQAVPGLDDLMLGLGADVPVCFACAATRMTGIGEKLEPVEALEEIPAVLVNPGRPCATTAVFGELKGAFGEKAPDYEGSDLIGYLTQTRNDLTQAASALVPEIAEALGLIEKQQGCRMARMSGSGATCFGLFGSEMEALEAAEEILRAHPNWWVRATVLNRIQRY